MKLARLTSWIVMGFMISNFFMGSLPMGWAQTARSMDASASAKPVSINKANLEELQAVRGIGPALAERIVKYREANGGFKSLDELKEVRGIGDLKFERLKNQITI